LVKILGRRRAVGLDIDAGAARALVLEGSSEKPRIVGRGTVPIAADNGSEAAQAIHAALANAGADGEPVVAAIGGPDVVVRQVTLPALPPSRVRRVLELQYRDFGLLPAAEGLLDVQVIRRSKTDCSVLAVSAPMSAVDARLRLLEQAAVKVRTLDVEALALLNGTLHLARPEPQELLLVLHLGYERALLCLRSGDGPVLVRYLDIGASALAERMRQAGLDVPSEQASGKSGQDPDVAVRAAEACRDIVRRVAEEIRRSLSFYRSEYHRESLPRYVLSGWLRLPQLNRWLTDELRLESPFGVIDPFQAVHVTAHPGDVDESAGPEFVQAFGLALRAL
jgi:type IV pilus assembly protein PilM